jgi:hypothetical protein
MDCRALLPAARAASRAQRPLEMFFPFDPFLLRRSAQVRGACPHMLACACCAGLALLLSLFCVDIVGSHITI